MPTPNVQFAPFDLSLARWVARWDAKYLVAPVTTAGEYGFVVTDSRGKIRATYKGRQYRGIVEGNGGVAIYGLNPTGRESLIADVED